MWFCSPALFKVNSRRLFKQTNTTPRAVYTRLDGKHIYESMGNKPAAPTGHVGELGGQQPAGSPPSSAAPTNSTTAPPPHRTTEANPDATAAVLTGLLERTWSGTEDDDNETTTNGFQKNPERAPRYP